MAGDEIKLRARKLAPSPTRAKGAWAGGKKYHKYHKLSFKLTIIEYVDRIYTFFADDDDVESTPSDRRTVDSAIAAARLKYYVNVLTLPLRGRRYRHSEDTFGAERSKLRRTHIFQVELRKESNLLAKLLGLPGEGARMTKDSKTNYTFSKTDNNKFVL